MGIHVRHEDATILGDWGTTNLRLSLIGADGNVLDTITSEDVANVAIGDVARGVFGRLTHSWCQSAAPGRAILCGMIGRKGGWIEAPCLPTDRWTALSQILGLLDRTPDFIGTTCLPGTHSKWCALSGGKIIGFRTEMTGEIYSLLSKRSNLRDAILAGQCEGAFDSGVEEGLNDPDAMQRLFSIRANWLLKDTKDAAFFFDCSINDKNPDGAITDVAGNIWIAMWGSSELLGVSSEGDEIGSIALPTPHVTCPASGASGSSDIYVTSALFGLPEDVSDTENPAGKTLLIKDAFQGPPNIPVKLQQPDVELAK